MWSHSYSMWHRWYFFCLIPAPSHGVVTWFDISSGIYVTPCFPRRSAGAWVRRRLPQRRISSLLHPTHRGLLRDILFRGDFSADSLLGDSAPKYHSRSESKNNIERISFWVSSLPVTTRRKKMTFNAPSTRNSRAGGTNPGCRGGGGRRRAPTPRRPWQRTAVDGEASPGYRRRDRGPGWVSIGETLCLRKKVGLQVWVDTWIFGNVANFDRGLQRYGPVDFAVDWPSRLQRHPQWTRGEHKLVGLEGYIVIEDGKHRSRHTCAVMAGVCTTDYCQTTDSLYFHKEGRIFPPSDSIARPPLSIVAAIPCRPGGGKRAPSVVNFLWCKMDYVRS